MATTPEPTTRPGKAESLDIINHLAGIEPDSPLGRLRAQRPEIMRFAQGSYETLLEPEDPAGVSRYERELIALRVATLTATPALADWHRERLGRLGAGEDVIADVERFPDGAALSERDAALIRHTDRVALQPASSLPEHIAALKAVGLDPRDIVTISQLISFLSYQARALAGLRLLAEEA